MKRLSILLLSLLVVSCSSGTHEATSLPSASAGSGQLDEKKAIEVLKRHVERERPIIHTRPETRTILNIGSFFPYNDTTVGVKFQFKHYAYWMNGDLTEAGDALFTRAQNGKWYLVRASSATLEYETVEIEVK